MNREKKQYLCKKPTKMQARNKNLLSKHERNELSDQSSNAR